MRGSPGFRFHDNENNFYERNILHKRVANEEATNNTDNDTSIAANNVTITTNNNTKTTVNNNQDDLRKTKEVILKAVADLKNDVFDNWEDWGEDFDDFHNLMEDASLYPPSFGLFDRTILTRVQKKDEEAAKRNLESENTSKDKMVSICSR